LSNTNVKQFIESAAPATAEMVKQFYVSDEISSIIMPGTKDYVSVNSEGKKVRFQKQLILCNLKEVYLSFKEQNPEKLLGFSKFAELWPKNCVGWSKWDTCSLCVYHLSECETQFRYKIV
jgi:hypothetical protein